MVNHADLCNGFQFDSFVCQKKNTIGEEGHGKPSHKIFFHRKNSVLSTVSAIIEIEYPR